MEGHKDDNMEVEEEFTAMWPENVNEAGGQFNEDRPRAAQDILNEVTINAEPSEIDMDHLHEMMGHSEIGSSQLSDLVKHWEYKQANAVRLLREEPDSLGKQREEAELKRLEIMQEFRFDKEQRAVPLEKMLEESRCREQLLMEKLEESLKNKENQSTPVQELSDMLKRADNIMHFILQNAPVVLGHMDKELRYRFIYNHYPSSNHDDIIGKTDAEISCDAGMKYLLDLKREVLERGLPTKREITFETEIFGLKTVLMYVEPALNKEGDTIGVNYIGMDITDHVRKRERTAKLREELAVQRAMETELNKTIHIAEETMRAKQKLATTSQEGDFVRHVLQLFGRCFGY